MSTKEDAQPPVVYIEPEPLPAGEALPAHIEAAWRTQGCAVVDGLWPDDAWQAALADAMANLPADRKDFGSGGILEFPTKFPSINALPLHPRVLAAARQLLGTDDIRLTQADMWTKTSREGGNSDQRVHCDFPNHTLVHPTPWDRPENLAIILYFNESDVVGGATAVVPREGPNDELFKFPYRTPGFAELPYVNDRTAAEEYLLAADPALHARRQQLYARERRVHFRPGTALLYRYDVWHRGTPLLPNSLRVVMNLAYRRADADHIGNWNRGFAYFMYSKAMTMEHLIATASVEQRNVLGFPRPGHRYWCPETVEAVGARYGPLGMDMKPYVDAMQAST